MMNHVIREAGIPTSFVDNIRPQLRRFVISKKKKKKKLGSQSNRLNHQPQKQANLETRRLIENASVGIYTYKINNVSFHPYQKGRENLKSD